ncbi:MAG: hypothetical protein ACI32E_02245 [Bacilli bacterium]
MSLKSIKQFFSNSFDTQQSIDHESTTHYYSTDYNHTLEAISVVAKKFNYKVKNVDEKYKEVLLMDKNGNEIIVTITTISYYENAVDMKINTHYFLSLGRPQNIVKKFYDELNRLITLKRIGGVVDEYNL